MENLKVGFGRVNITPEYPMPLASFGTAAQRYHDRVLNEIYFTAIAITDGDGRTLMLTTYDITQCWKPFYDMLSERLVSELGINPDYFHLSGTHTHSSIELALDTEGVKQYIETLLDKAVKACKLALEDRKEAEIYVGETKTRNLNFIRHYTTASGEVVSDNHGSTKQVYTGHITAPDESLRLIKFVRKNPDGTEARDVAIVNWQAHNHLTGGFFKKDLAADWSGAMRSFLESQHNCYATFFQGCAGNLNPKSRIKEENRTENYLEHGRFLAEHVNEIYDSENLKKLPAGKVVSVRDNVRAFINHAGKDKLEDAKKVVEFRREHGVNKECTALARELGFYSAFHASSIVFRSGITEEYREIPVCAYRIGDIGWTSAPFEVFDKTGKEIREASPFEFTITQGYTDGNNGYLPNEYAFEYGCYEADTTRFAKGTAEALRDKLIEMLKSIK